MEDIVTDNLYKVINVDVDKVVGVISNSTGMDSSGSMSRGNEGTPSACLLEALDTPIHAWSAWVWERDGYMFLTSMLMISVCGKETLSLKWRFCCKRSMVR